MTHDEAVAVMTAGMTGGAIPHSATMDAVFAALERDQNAPSSVCDQLGLSVGSTWADVLEELAIWAIADLGETPSIRENLRRRQAGEPPLARDEIMKLNA